VVILDKGLHPLDERYVGEYALRDELRAGAPGVSGSLRCPLCLGPLVQTHRQRRGYNYFKHLSDTDSARCPLATSSYQPEGLVVSALPRPLVAQEQRGRFLFNWKRHFRIARGMAPALSLERFTELIEYADVLNLWSYSPLELKDIPHVLLVLAGFMAVRSGEEEMTWVRFWFDGRVRDVGDLWRAGAPAAQLFRLVYRDPLHTPFPTAAELLYWERVARVERVQDISGAAISRTEMRAFDRFVKLNAATRHAHREDDDDE
jgi:hypothetical protein